MYLAAGYSFNKASSVATTTLNTVITYENENSQNEFAARSTYTDTDDDSTNSARANLGRNVWTDRSKMFTSSFANYETNDELQLDHRVGAGAGVGRYFVLTAYKRTTDWLYRVAADHGKLTGRRVRIRTLSGFYQPGFAPGVLAHRSWKSIPHLTSTPA